MRNGLNGDANPALRVARDESALGIVKPGQRRGALVESNGCGPVNEEEEAADSAETVISLVAI